MGAAAAGADPARRRREARPDRRSRAGRASRDEGARPRRAPPADRLGRVHFVGIGGAGLSGIARIMLARGIAGQRQRRHRLARPSTRCASSGARVHLGHDAAHVARRRHRSSSPPRSARTTPSTSRRGAAACGCCRARRPRRGDGRPPGARRRRHPRQDHDHLAAHRRPAGGRRRPDVRRRRRPRRDRRATPTRAPATCFVAEADESDGAFLVYRPHAAIVTNVEADHLDNWGTEEAYRAAFDEFAGPPRPAARRLPGLRASTTPAPPTSPASPADRGLAVVGVGESADADLRAVDLRFDGSTSTFTVHDGGPALGDGHAADPRAALRPRRARRARGRAPPRATPSTALRRGPRGLHRHPAADGAQGRGRPASASTTATPTTRSRSPATSQAARAVAGEGRRGRGLPAAPGLPHPDLRHRDGRGARRGRRGRRAATSTSPARTPTPRSPGPWSPTPCPLPAERVAFVARLRRRPGRAGRPGPPRRPGAHPRRRQRHPARPPRARAAGRRPTGPGARWLAPGRPGAAPPSPRTTRQGRAHPASLRAPAVGAPLADPGATSSACWCSSRSWRRRSGPCASPRGCPCSGVEVTGAAQLSAAEVRCGGRGARRRAAGRCRPRPDRARGSRRWPACARRT